MNYGKPGNLFIDFWPNHILAPSTSALKRVVVFLSEKLVTTHNNTWRLSSEYYNVNNHRYNYLRKYMFRNMSEPKKYEAIGETVYCTTRKCVTRDLSRAACIHRVGELDMYTVLCGETCSEMSIGKTNNKMEKHIVRICRSFSELSIGKTKNTVWR